MKYGWQAFLVYMARQLRSAKSWLMLLLMPALCGACILLLPQQELASPVQVGICLEAEGAEALWQQLQARNDSVITFIPASPEQIAARVATGRWDCGVLLPEDFGSRLEEGRTRKLFTLCISENSAVYPMVQETLSACLLPLLAPDIGRAYLQESGIGRDFSFDLQPLGPEDRVDVRMVSLDGRELEVSAAAREGRDRLLLGLVAIVQLIWMLFSAMDLGRWLQSDGVGRMAALQGTGAVVLPKALSIGIVPAAAGAVCAWMLTGVLRAGMAFLCWSVFLLGAALLFARFPLVWRNLPVWLPFVPPAALVLSPVLLDVSRLFPVLAAVSEAMPLTWLLEACDGRWYYSAALCLAGLILSIPIWIPKHKKISDG